MPDVVPGIADMLGAAGPCPEVEYNGRKWKIAPPIQGAKAELEELIISQAERQIDARRGKCSAERYQRYEEALQDSIEAGEYRTLGKKWRKAIFGNVTGPVLILQSLLRVHHKDATEEDAKGLILNKQAEVMRALARVAPDFFADVASEAGLSPTQLAEMKEQMTTALMNQFAVSPTPTE